MSDPREEIARVLRDMESSVIDWHGCCVDYDELSDALLPLFLRERERAEAAEATARLAWTMHGDEITDLRTRAERAEAALEEALSFINWHAEGPCGCDGDPDDPCDSCRAIVVIARAARYKEGSDAAG